MRTEKKAGRHRRSVVILAVFGLSLGVSSASYGFWFVCDWHEAYKNAKAANAAYNCLLKCTADPSCPAAELQAKQVAWKTLREATFDDLLQFAVAVPGSSITGPAPQSVKDLAKKIIKELAKEALGQIALADTSGIPEPAPLNDSAFAHSTGVLAARPAFDSIPVGEFSSDLIELEPIAYLAPEDYDGSLGPAPAGWDQESPIILFSGSFSGVPVGDFMVTSANPAAPAFGGLAYGLSQAAEALEIDPGLAEISLESGLIDYPVLQWLSDQDFSWDPAQHLGPGMHQISQVQIELDVASGTISGSFFTAALRSSQDPPVPVFIRGDADGDGTVNGLLDGLRVINFQFIPGTPAPPCMRAADADGSGVFNGLLDGLYLLNHQFTPGSPPPADPYPDCGTDNSSSLSCETPLAVCPSTL